MNKINKIAAFTLAEVLLVLTIIGVVSVLVLPSISDSYKEDESIARLRKIENDLDLAYQNLFQLKNFLSLFVFDIYFFSL